jgi:hypothetical protein
MSPYRRYAGHPARRCACRSSHSQIGIGDNRRDLELFVSSTCHAMRQNSQNSNTHLSLPVPMVAIAFRVFVSIASDDVRVAAYALLKKLL